MTTNTITPAEVGGLITELCDAAYRNAGPAGHEARIEYQAAALITSQAAEIERLREALKPFANAADERRPKGISGSVCFSQEVLLAARRVREEGKVE